MTNEQGWRIATDAEEYFGSQQKKVNLADRRPVPRKPNDLGLGPGINSQAVAITDFNDLLATYNGYFSAQAGTFGAPNSVEAFVGTTVMDAELGGVQLFTGMGDTAIAGRGHTYRRRFQRNPMNAASITWQGWVNISADTGPPIGVMYGWPNPVAPANYLICNGSVYDTTLYPGLLAVLGTNVLPDARDRALYGVGNFWSLGDTDGIAPANRTKTLTHNHNLTINSAGAHQHGGETGGAVGTAVVQSGSGTTVASLSHDHSYITSENGAHVHTGAANDSSPVLRGYGVNIIIRAK